MADYMRRLGVVEALRRQRQRQTPIANYLCGRERHHFHAIAIELAPLTLTCGAEFLHACSKRGYA